MDNRGKIKNMARYDQSKRIDFSGMRFERNITPTDVDMALEFKGNEFIFGEYKLEGADFLHGQKLCMENMCLAISSDKRKRVLAFLAEHNASVDQVIDASSARITSWWRFDESQWVEVRTEVRTVLEFINKWRNWSKKMEVLSLVINSRTRRICFHSTDQTSDKGYKIFDLDLNPCDDNDGVWHGLDGIMDYWYNPDEEAKIKEYRTLILRQAESYGWNLGAPQ